MVPEGTCSADMGAVQKAAEDAGVKGTPMIALADGTTIGGYLSPEMVLAAITRHEGVAMLKAKRVP
jgi:protein-disulfide isomerase